MSLQVGSNGGLVPKWQKVITAFYPKLALATNGGPLKVDGTFGYDDRDTQMRVQAAHGLPQTGVVTNDDLINLGVMPVAFTVHGTGMPDPLGPGLPADWARQLLDIVHWQPIGNYPAAPFPMWASILQGWAELRLQISDYLRRYPLARIVLCGYSQGAIVVAMCMYVDFMQPNGMFHQHLDRVKLGVTWGNPMREHGKANGNVVIGEPIPDGHGILKQDMVGTPDYWYDFAHGANGKFGRDIYTDAEYGTATGADETAICDFIMSEHWYDGPLALLSRLADLPKNPISGSYGAVEAVMEAGMFFVVKGIRPHTTYTIDGAVNVARRVLTAV